MRVVTTRTELADARSRLGRVGLVPTMGYLHEGHLSLVRRAREENDAVAVSIFVNPTQFGDASDFEGYPRDTARDLALLAEAGVDLVWTPEVEDVYPTGFATGVTVAGPAEVLEGAHRPGHFAGVATVVTILLNASRADRAYFGQKDAQQVVVVRQMVADLAMPVEIVTVPTRREADGVAMSSRNVRLGEGERAHAPVIWQALEHARSAWAAGELDAGALRDRVTATLRADDLFRVEYVSVADPETLDELSTVGPDRGALVSLAAHLGGVRLIDNVLLDPQERIAR